MVRTELVFVNVYGAQESIPSAYVAWRAGTTSRGFVPARQVGNRFLGSFKGLQIRAQGTDLPPPHLPGRHPLRAYLVIPPPKTQTRFFMAQALREKLHFPHLKASKKDIYKYCEVPLFQFLFRLIFLFN